MTQPPFININDAGVAFLAESPKSPPPGKSDYDKKPVKVAVHHDLTIELHGANFSTSTKLTPDEALGLISMLAYVVREKLYVEGLRK